MALTIWTNTKFDPAVTQLLHDGTRAHRLVTSDIAFGQPDPVDCLRYPNIKWVEVSTAGYTRYDTPEFLETFRSRGSAFTNASAVFADPCAQHVLAMMLSLGRQLLPSHRDQLTDQSWHYEERRYHSRLLTGQSLLMLGYGAIGRRLTELLAPFGMTLYALRRQTRSETGVRIVPETELTRVLPLVDHIVNILPANPATAGYVNARRLACCRPTAKFYNVGRGTTVDQPALAEALRSKKISAAYLDVMDPEPLPPAHELWTTPNCYITPHTAGGRHDQDETIVRHFLQNLAAYESGGAMTDRVV